MHDLPGDRLSCVSPPPKCYKMHYIDGEVEILPNPKDNNQLQSISETTCHKNWARLLKIGAQRWIRFSKYVILVYKQKEVIVYWFVLINNLSRFLEIHFH